ncbi:hypothetical protein P154DRAFT_524544, partial [Amniculicola lignicola CBS 123094]
SYTSHLTHEFVTYAYNNQILLYAFLPYTTHFIQLLDIGCFQPLKTYYGQELNLNAYIGGKAFIKADFLAVVNNIRRRTFTPKNCKGVFKRIGIILYKPKVRHYKQQDKKISAWQKDNQILCTPLPPPELAEWKTLLTIRSLRRGLNILNAKMDNKTC